jgi:hypothetical protein
MPFATVHQYLGRTFGKMELAKDNSKALRDAWLWCVDRAARAGGRWLIITHKAAEGAIRERLAIPPFIELAHFGAVAGRQRSFLLAT